MDYFVVMLLWKGLCVCTAKQTGSLHIQHSKQADNEYEATNPVSQMSQDMQKIHIVVSQRTRLVFLIVCLFVFFRKDYVTTMISNIHMY